MKNAKLFNQLLTILFLLSFLSTSAAAEEYTIKGKFINYKAGDLQGLQIVATTVTPAGQVPKDIGINGYGEFYITGKSFKKLNQIWFSIGDIYYGEILISTSLSIIVDFNQLSRSNVTFYGSGIKFEGTDAEATILANKWTNYHRKEQLQLNSTIQGISYLPKTESEKIDSLSSLFKKVEELEVNFLNKNPSNLSWILEDKRKSEFYNQLFSISDKEEINWKILKDALEYTPQILGNSGWLFYRYGSFVLSEAYIGSNIMDNWEKQEKNLDKFDSSNTDFLILSGIPDNIRWKEGYLLKFLPHVKAEWAREYMNELLLKSKSE